MESYGLALSLATQIDGLQGLMEHSNWRTWTKVKKMTLLRFRVLPLMS